MNKEWKRNSKEPTEDVIENKLKKLNKILENEKKDVEGNKIGVKEKIRMGNNPMGNSIF